MLKGIVASRGFAVGAAFVYRPADLSYESRTITDTAVEAERVRGAFCAAANQLEQVKEATRERLGDDSAHIFRSQQTIAQDEAIVAEVVARIESESCCAERALTEVFDAYAALFAELDDGDYNKARGDDVRDVYRRVLRLLMGRAEVDVHAMGADAIVVAADLLPSDTALLDPARVRGMITERGGATSHVAILAANLGIPAAVGVNDALSTIKHGDAIVLDTAGAPDEARVHINPDTETRTRLQSEAAMHHRRRLTVEAVRGLEAVTPDGHRMTLSANVGTVAEARAAREAGARSIGLFRSEFLFIGRPAPPDEQTQFEAYRNAAECYAEGFVIVRTLDVGGDKQVPSLTVPHEDNPFLGYRALRVSLDRLDLFEPQLRAILRASAYGTVKVMFPMVSGVMDLRRALSVLERCRAQLRAAGVPFDESMEVGVMIEIPAAVMAAADLANEVDFFSIGTNDLTQYLLAADRMNAHVSEYYRSFDPAVFRSIRLVVEAAHARGKWVGVCGELGGNPAAVAALMGLGVNELSMSPANLDEATYIVRTTPLSDARRIAQAVLTLDSHEQIAALLREDALPRSEKEL